jgi:hypothetical protein
MITTETMAEAVPVGTVVITRNLSRLIFGGLPHSETEVEGIDVPPSAPEPVDEVDPLHSMRPTPTTLIDGETGEATPVVRVPLRDEWIEPSLKVNPLVGLTERQVRAVLDAADPHGDYWITKSRYEEAVRNVLDATHDEGQG